MTWQFFDFNERFNQWVDDDNPPEDFRFWVMAWLYRMQDDPTVDAARADALGDPWWFARIPNAESASHAVVCLYRIDDNNVRCSGFTTLPKPVF